MSIIEIYERFEDHAKNGRINEKFWLKYKSKNIKSYEKAKALEIKKSKDRVEKSIKSKKFNTLANEIPFVGVAYINGKLVEYGYEPTFWNSHLRNQNGKMVNVKEHFKVIRRKK